MRILALAVLVVGVFIAAACSSDVSGDAASTGTAAADPCAIVGSPFIGSCDWRKAPDPKEHCSDYTGGDAGAVMCQEDDQNLFATTVCDRSDAIGCCVGKENGLDRLELFFSGTDSDIAACKADPSSVYHDLQTP